MTTTSNTMLDSAIEQATENTKATSGRLREFAQIGARKATEGYEQFSKAAQTATEQITTQAVEARDGAAKAGLKLLDVAKEDSDAAYAAMRDFLAAKSPLEAFDVSASYWRGRLEARLVQAQDLGAFARKTADDVVRPIQQRLEKFAKAAA